MSIPHPIPYQGSKRALAPYIMGFFPDDIERLVEPFAGSGAISIAAAISGKTKRFLLNDANEPLIRLWQEIVERPLSLAKAYTTLWTMQSGCERQFYDEVRAR